MAFIYDLTDTWNNAGISFNGIKLNATDTASAAGSKLLDLQISGASKFTVGKTGTVIATGLIESTVGGFKFPDGTTQTTKATVNSVSGTGTVNGITLTGTVTDSGSLTLGGTLGNIANNQLTNSAITINGTSTPLGGSIAVGTVTSVSGTGTVSGLSLTGSITTSGSLTLGGTLVLTSGQVTDALGYTPYDATNPTGYITASALTPYLTSATAATTYQPLDGDLTAIAALAGTAGLVRKTDANTYALDTAVYITGITSGDVTTALGYTPYNDTNPAGYTTNVGTVTNVTGAGSVSGLTLTGDVTTSGALTLGGTLSLTSSDVTTGLGFTPYNATNPSGYLSSVSLTSNVTGTLPIANGGTGATTASGARTALGLGTAAVLNAGVSGGVATLDGSGTVPTSQLPGAVLGGLNYQGTWNASTNVPTLASSTGSKGHYYVVSVAGSTNLDGITDWKIGDWAVYDGSAWQKVDNTDAVSSVNGYTGTVVLTTSDVAEGTNLYFTQAAARGSVSAGTGISYDSGTGVITNSAPDQTVALTGAGTTTVTGTYPNFTITSNDSTVGTVTSVAASGGTTGLTFTGSPITTAGTLTLGGTLAVANGGTGATTLTSGYVLKGNGTSAVSASVLYDDGTNIGIGTSSPAYPLQVRRAGGAGSLGISIDGVGATDRAVQYFAIQDDAAGSGSGHAFYYRAPSSTTDTLGLMLDEGGNVGIGTNAPGGRLQVDGNFIRYGNSASYTSDEFLIQRAAAGVNLSVRQNTNMILLTNDTERMRIDTSGNVSITGSGNGTLTLGSSAGAYSSVLNMNSSAGGGSAITASQFLGVHTSGTERMRINAGGTVGVGVIPATWDTNQRAIQIGQGGVIFGSMGSPTIHISTNTYYSDDYRYLTTEAAARYLQFQGSHLFYTAPSGTAGSIATYTERMRVDGTGNVGIGTASPASKLNVAGGNVTVSAGYGIAWSGDQTRIMTPEDNVVGALINWGAGGGCRFISGTSERMRIDGGGLVGIGTSTPFTTLDISGTGVGGTGWVGRFGNTSTVGVLLGVRSGVASVGTQGAANLSLNPDGGNVGIGTGSPGNKLSVAGGQINTVADEAYGIALNATTGNVRIIPYVSAYGGSGLVSYTTNYAGYGPLTIDAANIRLWTAGNERMRIDSSGNVGIGTSSPATKLEVKGAGFVATSISGDSTSETQLRFNTNTSARISQQANQALIFDTNALERMRIDSSGNLLVGTTALPSGSGTSGVGIRNVSGVIGQIIIGKTQSGTVDAQTFYYSGTYVGGIQISDTATSLITSSDVRLKHDIVDAPEASSLIDAIQVRSFKWNADNSKQRYGFVAQELVTVAPEAVSQPADPDDMMGVDYSKLVPMLVKEIQSLRARVAQLEGN